MSYPNKDLCLRCMGATLVNGRCPVCGATEENMRSKTNEGVLAPESMLKQRYVIGGVIGQGGFGITYVAWDTKADHRIAVKELFPKGYVKRDEDGKTVRVGMEEREAFASMLESFQRETQTLIQLQNRKGIVALYHVFEENNTAYYVMEYLQGQDFRKFMSEHGTLTWSQAAPMARAILEAMEQLHAAGLIHRDISPDNIFMTSDGGYRLIDLGSARAYQGVTSFTAYVKMNFAPYEQFQSKGNQGPWTDIYSFCATLYYMLSGKVAPNALQRYQNDTMVPLNEYCPDLPVSVMNAIHKGLQVRVEDRCKSAAELRSIMFPTGSGYTTASRIAVQCIAGINQGAFVYLKPNEIVRIGRSAECSIVYPASAQGISRRQCTFCLRQDGRVWVYDENSTYGTYAIGGGRTVRLQPMAWTPAENCIIAFGKNEQYRVIRR